MAKFRYFKIPFDQVPKTPPFKVWYASWSTVRPEPEDGIPPPVVVGLSLDGTLPDNATELASGDGVKNPPPPPPPLAPVTDAAYAEAVGKWLKDTQSG